jgi:membrane protein DedA with SNARE-associated domain
MAFLDGLTQVTDVLSGSAWTYPLIAAIAGGDAVVPVLPGETAVITGGVLSGSEGLMLWLVIVAGAVGAFTGDSLSFLIGRKAGPLARRTLFRGRKGAAALAWAERQLATRGATLIVVARFVPGGRTATTFVAGATDFGYRRFAPPAVLGAALWSSYAALIGRIGGAAFEDETWKALLLAFGVAVVAGGLIELGRKVVEKRRVSARER